MAIKRDFSDDGWSEKVEAPKANVARRDTQAASRRSIEKMSTCSRASTRCVPTRSIVTEVDGSWDDEDYGQKTDTGKSYSARSNSRSIEQNRTNIFGGPRSHQAKERVKVNDISVNIIDFSHNSQGNVPTQANQDAKPSIQEISPHYRQFAIPKQQHDEYYSSNTTGTKQDNVQKNHFSFVKSPTCQQADVLNINYTKNQANANQINHSFVEEMPDIIPNHLLRTNGTSTTRDKKPANIEQSRQIGSKSFTGQETVNNMKSMYLKDHENVTSPIVSSACNSTPLAKDFFNSEIKKTVNKSFSSQYSKQEVQSSFTKPNSAPFEKNNTISSFQRMETNNITKPRNAAAGGFGVFSRTPCSSDIPMVEIPCLKPLAKLNLISTKPKSDDFDTSAQPLKVFSQPAVPQEAPSGLGAFFGREFQETVVFPPEPVQRNSNVTESNSGYESEAIGFGRPSANFAATAFSKYLRDGQRPPSTFVPPEETIERLFQKRISPGKGFESLFQTDIEIIRGGLRNTTRMERMTTFDSIHLTEQVRTNLKAYCNYEHPTPVQQYTMPLISDGSDILACAQTGSGKTAAFLIPIISNLLEMRDFSSAAEPICYPRCLVLAPTRELAFQIYNEGRQFGYGPGNNALNIKVIFGGTCVDYQKREIAKGATILVATVGRFKHFLADGIISLEKVKFLVLDEADRMLDMGFLKDIEGIIEDSSLPPAGHRQTLMFSATFPPSVQIIAQKLLKPNYTMVTVDKIGIACRSVKQEFIQCEGANKLETLLDVLNIKNYQVNEDSEIFKTKTIVFVQSKLFADTLAAMLIESCVPCTSIHGDRSQQNRDEALREFISGRKAVLIATGVAERGLDIKGVDLIVNYDLPKEIDTYIHRIGRTGRIGNPGRSVSLFTNQDSLLAPAIVQALKDVGQPVPSFLEENESLRNELSAFGEATNNINTINEAW